MTTEQPKVSPQRYVQSGLQRRIEEARIAHHLAVRMIPAEPTTEERKELAEDLLRQAIKTAEALGVGVFVSDELVTVDSLVISDALVKTFDMQAAADGCVSCIVAAVSGLSCLGVADGALVNVAMSGGDVGDALRAQGWNG